MGRSLVALTTLTGGVGLGLAIAYVMLVVASFAPGGERVAAFMIGLEGGPPGYGFILLVVPYGLLLLHLWLRIRVAEMLVDQGEVELARKFASRRLRVSVLRNKREALANRTALMRLAIRELDYDEAEALAEDAALPRQRWFTPSDVLAAFHRWRLEAALRVENLVRAREIVEEAWPIGGRSEAVAAFCACAAELAVRNRDHEAYLKWTERARFADDAVERLDVVELLAAHRFDAEVSTKGLSPTPQWLDDVPGAALEWLEVGAAMLPDDQSTRWRTAAKEALDRADRRSKQVRESLSDDADVDE